MGEKWKKTEEWLAYERAVESANRSAKWKKVAIAVTLVLIPMVVILIGWAIFHKTPAQKEAQAWDRSSSAAFVNCVNAIKSTAIIGAGVPYSKDFGSVGVEHYFAWGSGSGLYFKNAFGVEIPASASCITSPDGRITSLTINNETIR